MHARTEAPLPQELISRPPPPTPLARQPSQLSVSLFPPDSEEAGPRRYGTGSGCLDMTMEAMRLGMRCTEAVRPSFVMCCPYGRTLLHAAAVIPPDYENRGIYMHLAANDLQGRDQETKRTLSEVGNFAFLNQ